MSHLGCKCLSLEGASLLGLRSMTKSVSIASDIRDMYETKVYTYVFIYTDVKIHMTKLNE